jgi:hypothetical protein|tara:strand:+ start:7251 stop:7895 length:645 start_codon:yes stop_codon:yes gene_type:complete
MNRRCVSIVIEVPNALTAVEEYQYLFNCGAAKFSDDVYLLALKNVDLWLKQTTVIAARIAKINLAGDEGQNSPIAEFQICPPSEQKHTTDVGINMVVYMTNSPQQMRGKLAAPPLNLQLKNTITLGETNAELSFYPLDGLLLEVGEYENKDQHEDGFWGLGLAVEDINEYHRYLRAGKVDISDIKSGMKRNTLVATIKSHNLGIPTLLVGDNKD